VRVGNTFSDLFRSSELERELDVLEVALHAEVELEKVIPRHHLLQAREPIASE
jgi:hypothetical protein